MGNSQVGLERGRKGDLHRLKTSQSIVRHESAISISKLKMESEE